MARSTHTQNVFQAIHKITMADDSDGLLNAVVDGVREVVGKDASAAIVLAGRNGKLDLSTYRADGSLADFLRENPPRQEGGITAWVVEHGDPVFESNVEAGESTNHPSLDKKIAQLGAYACLPLRTPIRVIGALFIRFREPFLFSKTIKSSLESFASLASRTIEIRRLQEEIEQQRHEQRQLVGRISQQLVETWQQRDPEMALENTFDEILRQLEQVLPTEDFSASVYVYEETTGFRSHAARGALKEYMEKYPPRLGKEEGTAIFSVRRKKPVFVDNTDQMPAGIPPLSQQSLEVGVRAFANLPLLLGEEGEQNVAGILIINLDKPFHFGDDVQAMLQLYADRAAIALQAARVHRRRLREQAALQRISEAVASGSMETVGDVIAKEVVELTGANHATFWGVNETGEKLELRGRCVDDPAWVPANPVLLVEEKSINAYTFRTMSSHYAPRVTEDPHHLAWDRDTKSAYCVPVVAAGEKLGTLYAASNRENDFSPNHQAFIDQLATHAAVALYNARLLDSERIQRERAEAFQAIVAAIHSKTNLEEVGDAILEQLGKVVPYKTASLQVIYGDRRRLIAGKGFEIATADPKYERPLSEDEFGRELVERKQILIIPDVSRRLGWGKLEGVNSWCGVPLLVEDKVAGLITLDHAEVGFYDQDLHEKLLESFANHAALALRDAQRKRALDTLSQWALKLGTLQKPIDVYDAIIKAVVEILECAYCMIFLAEADGTLVAERGGGTLYKHLPLLTFPPGKGLAGWVYQNRKSDLVADTSNDDRYVVGPSEAENKIRPRSILSSPLRRGEKVIGVVSADFDRINAFDQNDLRLLDSLTAHASIVLQNLEYMDDLEALHEAARRLAGLPERSEIYKTTLEAVSQAIHASHATLFIYDHESGLLEPVRREGAQTPARSFKPGEGLAGVVFLNGEPLLENNAAQNPDFLEGLAAKREEPRSIILAPIKSDRGVIGVLTADKDEVDGFTQRDLNTLETLALDISVALRAHQKDMDLAALSQFQEKISALAPVGKQLENIYRATAEVMRGLMDTRNMYIALYDAATDLIEFPFWYERGRLIPDQEKIPGHQAASRKLSQRKGLTGWVIDHKSPLLIEKDFQINARSLGIEVYDIGTKCWLGAPMILRGEVMGVIGLQNFDQEGAFDERHQSLLATIAGQAAIALDNARQYDRINYQLLRQIKELEAVSRFQQAISKIDLGEDDQID